ncbi:MAG: ketopantoate reductase family protein [Alphaproteobacteria bacterium]
MTFTNKRIAVLGTGSIGSCVGADLTDSGLDVVLIDQWAAHVEAMKEKRSSNSVPGRRFWTYL